VLTTLTIILNNVSSAETLKSNAFMVFNTVFYVSESMYSHCSVALLTAENQGIQS